MLKQILHDNWTVRAVGDLSQVPQSIRDATIPARVPGCVHTDLMRAGLIDDPYFGTNEPKLLWIGETDWQYRSTFEADAKLFDHERIDLCFDGLDTVATIELNGTEVARTQNMHRGYRFDVRKHLKKGSNELLITFASPVKYANAMLKKLGHLPSINYGIPFNFIRKMACNFGWDWGPVVSTCGIWRGVRVEGWSVVRIESVTPRITSLDSKFAAIELSIVTEKTSATGWDLWAILKGSKSNPATEWRKEHSKDVAVFHLENPQLWSPRGHGSQSAYEVLITAWKPKTDDYPGNQLDELSCRIGLRTTELDTSPDDIGRKFVLKVNGQPVFCKGFNWIPDDCFPERANDRDRLRKRLQQVIDCNANMIRVWGGGIYETDEFYDLCDEMGIMVWQDFLFACGAYPEEEPFKTEVEEEARYNVSRLAHHPSLVLWNGCNENVWGYHVWHTADENGQKKAWKEQLKDKKWGTGYYFDLLPRVLNELDPSRPYWPASPWSGDSDVAHGLHPNLSTHGNKHIWEVWHGPGDYNGYRMYSPRFCSEFGYQSPANYSTLAKFFPPEDLKRGSPSMAMHQKSPGGNERNDRLASKDFNLPENFDDWHYLLQLDQARALKVGCEWFRSRQPRCMGTLYWQLNDCYPAISWSAIDSEGQLKPLYWSTKRFYAPRLLTIQPEADTLVLYANNDTDEPWVETIHARRLSFDGKESGQSDFELNAAPRTNVRLAVLPIGLATTTDAGRQFLVAKSREARAIHYYTIDKETHYPAPVPRAALSKHDGGYKLLIETEMLLRDVMINIDRLDTQATVSDNLFTILPGETKEVMIRTATNVTAEQLMNPPVFQCANRFGK